MTEIKLLELTAESKEKQTAKIKIRKNKQPTRKEKLKTIKIKKRKEKKLFLVKILGSQSCVGPGSQAL